MFSFKTKRKLLRAITWSLKRKWYLFTHGSKNLSVSSFIATFLKYTFFKLVSKTRRTNKKFRFYAARKSYLNLNFFVKSLQKFFFD